MIQHNNKKRLEGIVLTDSWKELLEQAQQKANNANHSMDGDASGFAAASNDDDDNDAAATTVASCYNSNYYSYPMPQSLALSTLRNYQQQQKEQAQKEGSSSSSLQHLPIKVVLSIAVILGPDRVAQALAGENTSNNTQLAFTTTQPPSDANDRLSDEQKRFRRRMERLRLKQEEEKYGNLTKNLNLSVKKDDDVTTKSMTYAASIGLNMIVAPISFGGFMWFFAGNAIDYFWPAELSHKGATDIRRVIVGVISGVLMLFIEMLLFVIRTHELDRAMRRKSKQKKEGPFGYYTSETVKTFKED